VLAKSVDKSVLGLSNILCLALVSSNAVNKVAVFACGVFSAKGGVCDSACFVDFGPQSAL